MTVTEMPSPDDVPTQVDAPDKSSKMPLILGVVLALLSGGGGFYATWSGMILGDGGKAEKPAETKPEGTALDLAFVPMDQLVISLGQKAAARHLRFRAELEVPGAYKEDVEMLMPRVVDVLNSYLRALEPSDLEDQAALVRLRAQMLRRVQVVVGQERVNDLLVMEFVLN